MCDLAPLVHVRVQSTGTDSYLSVPLLLLRIYIRVWSLTFASMRTRSQTRAYRHSARLISFFCCTTRTHTRARTLARRCTALTTRNGDGERTQHGRRLLLEPPRDHYHQPWRLRPPLSSLIYCCQRPHYAVQVVPFNFHEHDQETCFHFGGEDQAVPTRRETVVAMTT